jgi:hypothetical protein
VTPNTLENHEDIKPTYQSRRHALGEKLPLFQPSFNEALRVEARPERLSSDAGVILQCAVIRVLVGGEAAGMSGIESLMSEGASEVRLSGVLRGWKRCGAGKGV